MTNKIKMLFAILIPIALIVAIFVAVKFKGTSYEGLKNRYGKVGSTEWSSNGQSNRNSGFQIYTHSNGRNNRKGSSGNRSS